MLIKRLIVVVVTVLLGVHAHARLTVVTSTADLAEITRVVSQGADVSVESIAKGTQDPHFIEAKPSFMVKLNKADLVISIGLGLEEGWLPSVIHGARNPVIREGQKGFLAVGPQSQPLEVAVTKVSRSDGDVHPEGNPHITLDPVRVGKIAGVIADKLAALDASSAQKYRQNAAAFNTMILNKTKEWQERIRKSGIQSVVTHHKTLTYFFDRFGVSNTVILEPKPGIPPTAKHIMDVVSRMKQDKIRLVLIENFFDDTPAKRIVNDVPGARVAVIPVSIQGSPAVGNFTELFETIVRTFEGK